MPFRNTPDPEVYLFYIQDYPCPLPVQKSFRLKGNQRKTTFHYGNPAVRVVNTQISIELWQPNRKDNREELKRGYWNFSRTAVSMFLVLQVLAALWGGGTLYIDHTRLAWYTEHTHTFTAHSPIRRLEIC